MKKLVSVVLCGVMCMVLTACGMGAGKPKWVTEATQMMDTDIRSGEFVLNGKKYTFPMTFQELLDDGWTVSGSYENTDEFILEPDYESSEFELFNEGDGYISVCVYNDTTEDAHLDGCIVSYLSISMTGDDLEVTLPGGLYRTSKPADVIEAYGEADVTDTQPQVVEYMYEYKDESNWITEVTIQAIDNNYTQDPLSRVKYYLASYEE